MVSMAIEGYWVCLAFDIDFLETFIELHALRDLALYNQRIQLRKGSRIRLSRRRVGRRMCGEDGGRSHEERAGRSG
ncbi:hypothetical protein BLNAU_24546 [Blattamonas nauphoetae]|uniref:Uncharacterized protein n=1 Tax=Blattamonas nauphoetae TaxID=2049346 RepID=A0ABQ9WM54_9EUKA|nr:hypothetical protein BLNAU_24546 [Blattamonas nauphoetae]